MVLVTNLISGESKIDPEFLAGGVTAGSSINRQILQLNYKSFVNTQIVVEAIRRIFFCFYKEYKCHIHNLPP
jgi:hypothetical protein